MSASAAVRFRRGDGALSREVDGEVLIVPLPEQVLDLDDCFFCLQDPVALRVWALLGEGAPTLDELTARVTLEFEVAPTDAARDLAAFLARLVEVGAVEQVAGP